MASADATATPRPRLGTSLQRLARVPVLYKILGANAAIVIAGAVVGTATSLQHGARHPGAPHYALVAGFILAGVAASIATNYLVLRAVLQPLEHLQRAVEGVRSGVAGVRVARAGLWDQRFDHLADAFDRMVATVEEHAARLRRLPGQILRAQEEERRRIARELHDEAAQSLTSLLVRLRLLEQARTPDKAQERVTELRDLTSRALEDVRRIALELRPAALDDLGLVAALHAHIDQLNEAGGLRVHFDTAIADVRLPPEVELALYRVAQEALTNVRRHSRATDAWVRLRQIAGDITLEVQDNGVGFDPAPAVANGSGLGLAGMEDRMALISGRLEVRSTPGGGTAVLAAADLAHRVDARRRAQGGDPQTLS